MSAALHKQVSEESYLNILFRRTPLNHDLRLTFGVYYFRAILKNEFELLVYYISCISYYVDPIGDTGTCSVNNYLVNLKQLDQAPNPEKNINLFTINQQSA